MDMVTIPRKEYERLKALEKEGEYVKHAQQAIQDAKNGRVHRVN